MNQFISELIYFLIASFCCVKVNDFFKSNFQFSCHCVNALR